MSNIRVWFLVAVLGLACIAATAPYLPPPTVSAFGSQVFTVSWLQSPAPNPSQASEWSPIVSCGQSNSAPTLMYADDPETWDTVPGDNSWDYKNPNTPQPSTVNNLLLEQGSLGDGAAGYIYFYFDNKLGVTARLYIGGVGPASLKYMVSETTGPDSDTLSRDGAMQTAAFLSNLVPGNGLQQKTLGPPSVTGLPTQIVSYSVSNNTLIQGEMFVTGLTAAATFDVYADDCTGTPCPSTHNKNLTGDSHMRRGNFANAEYDLDHNDTTSIETTGGFAWYDVVGPNSCVGAINGVDPFGQYTPRNTGDYGVPIIITGTPSTTQYWFLMGSPAGMAPGTPDAFSVYVSGLTDPATGVDVTGAWAVAFPTSNPPTPSPQPTDTPLICCAQSAVLGTSATLPRTIEWIPSGGEALPARFWYNVPVPKKNIRVQRSHR